MEKLEKNQLLFDDRELDELNDEEINISKQDERDLENEIDKYFQENKIEFED